MQALVSSSLKGGAFAVFCRQLSSGDFFKFKTTTKGRKRAYLKVYVMTAEIG
jgi:hypothetical protein